MKPVRWKAAIAGGAVVGFGVGGFVIADDPPTVRPDQSPARRASAPSKVLGDVIVISPTAATLAIAGSTSTIVPTTQAATTTAPSTTAPPATTLPPTTVAPPPPQPVIASPDAPSPLPPRRQLRHRRRHRHRHRSPRPLRHSPRRARTRPYTGACPGSRSGERRQQL